MSENESEGFNLFKDQSDSIFKRQSGIKAEEEEQDLSADEKYTSSDEDIDLAKIVKEQTKDV